MKVKGPAPREEEKGRSQQREETREGPAARLRAACVLQHKGTADDTAQGVRDCGKKLGISFQSQRNITEGSAETDN